MKTVTFGLFLLTALVFTQEPLHILIKMMPEQEEFFRDRILREFEKAAQCQVQVSTYSDNWELKKMLEDSRVDVVKVPMGAAASLVKSRQVFPISDIIDAEKMTELKKVYFLLKRAVFDGKLYYIPRKFETRIMIYMKSKVREAVREWRTMRPAIDSLYREAFQRGLPGNYELDEDPNTWTYLDLFVAGCYWSRKPHNGEKLGRIAHRGKIYSGTAVSLMDRCFQAGADRGDLTRIESRYFNEVLFLESVFAAYGIYHAESWENGWDGRGLWMAMEMGSIFLTFFTQIDCYFLRGITGAATFIENPDDLGFAVVPEAIGADGKSNGRRGISSGGWFWGIGAGSNAPAKALELIEFITSRKIQELECVQFGMIPVRNDLLKASVLDFDADWKIETYNVSVRQLKLNSKSFLPFVEGFEGIERKYIDVWLKVMQMSESKPVRKSRLRALQKEAK